MIVINNIVEWQTVTSGQTYPVRISSSDEVLVILVADDSANQPTAVTFNGVTLTSTVGILEGTSEAATIYIVWNPPVGTYPVVVTDLNTGSITVTAISLLGVSKRTTNPITFTNSQSAFGTGILSTAFQAASANSIVLDVIAGNDASTLVFTPQSPQVQLTQLINASGNTAAASYMYVNPGPQATQWNVNVAATPLAYAAVVLEPDDAPSIWYPNVQIRSQMDGSGLLNALAKTIPTTKATTNYNYKQTEFYQNSFLHTVGRYPHVNTSSGGVVNASVTQVGASITFTGGTQAVAAVQIAAVTQVGASITFTGGTQAVASIQDVSIAQVAASITFAGGTQAVSAVPIFESAAPSGEQQTSQIIIDKVYQGKSSAGAAYTVDVNIPSNDAILVVTGGSVIATGGAWVSVTYNGNLLTSLVDQNTSGADAEIWYAPNPPVGVYTLVVTPTASTGEAYVNAMVILGVDKKSVNLQTVAASNNGTIVSATLAPDAPNSLMLSVLSALDTLGEPVPLQTQNQIFAPSGINANEYIEVAFWLTSSSQTIGYSLGTLSNASLVAVTLRPANAASIWYPNIDQRQLNTVVDANALDQAVTPIPGTYGYNQTLFYQNSFLHTVGREFLGYKHIVVTISQVAASITFTGGTQAVATVQDVSVAQVAASITFTGGTQVVASVATVAVSQSAATLTFTGGTQLVETNATIAQAAANLTFTGGTQVVATVNIVAISQAYASITFTGGTQSIVVGGIIAISQVGASINFTGGTQAVAAVGIVAISQSHASLNFTGGTQAVSAFGLAVIAQIAANLTFSGGTQSISADYIPSVIVPISTTIQSGLSGYTVHSGENVESIFSGAIVEGVISGTNNEAVQSGEDSTTIQSGEDRLTL